MPLAHSFNTLSHIKGFRFSLCFTVSLMLYNLNVIYHDIYFSLINVDGSFHLPKITTSVPVY